MMRVSVQHAAFDPGAEIAALLAACPEAGGLASFLGIVRSTAAHPIVALELEHYPAMTTMAIDAIARGAATRFSLQGGVVIHRFGRLAPGEPIVLVLTAAHHRAAALDGCAFLIDWLKTAAPFWKKEHLADGTAGWVQARAEDAAAARRWRPG